ncbi:MAG: SAM-dependent methyltransferase [Kutzneria sp.]|nr:SAM-dependent methyltransferase [Kutzneria sp.]
MAGMDGPAEIDFDAPATARIYDYVLGGALNFAADRETARELLKILPGYRDFAVANRAFLRRALLNLLDAGIRQFLDLGSGVPTVCPVHEVVHKFDPTCRVVYVDKDPVATEYSRIITAEDDRLGVVMADMCDVDQVLGHDVTREVLDFTQPIGLLMVAVLHFVPDSVQAADILAAYHDRLPVGSQLAASHATGDSLGATVTAVAEKKFALAGVNVITRSRSQFSALLGPWRIAEDGVRHTNQWRPEDEPDQCGEASLGYALLATSTRT